MPNRETGNNSEASRDSRIKDLALWDWQRKPVVWIRKALGDCHYVTLCNYRATELYKQTLEDLKQQWDDAMRSLPETSALRKKVTQAMSLGLDAVIDILAGASSDKDKIAAARLAAQMDGRFLHAGEDEAARLNRDVESMAQELLEGIKRHQGVVN